MVRIGGRRCRRKWRLEPVPPKGIATLANSSIDFQYVKDSQENVVPGTTFRLDSRAIAGSVRGSRLDIRNCRWHPGTGFIVPAEFRKGGMKPKPYTLKADTVAMLQFIRTLTPQLNLAVRSPFHSVFTASAKGF
jgi:hypothetical protein